jgi:hypothetical protein
VNSYEIAILRILIKMQKPVSIPYLVEGFPNNSEDFVLWAIGNLLKSGFICYLDNQKRDCIIYNKQKRKEILKSIDPLPDLGTDTEALSSIPKQELKEQKPILTTDGKIGSSSRSHSVHKQPYRAKIAWAISILSIGSVIILGNMTSTSSIYRHFGLLDVYYYHHDYYPSYNMAVYYDQLAKHSVYNPKFTKSEEMTADNSVLLYLPHESLQKCNV